MILFKNNHYKEDEKLFSTGNEELDDILEEVYYSGLEDGYDYAQKEFAENKEKKENKKIDKTGATLRGSSIAAGLGTAGIGVAKMAEAKKLEKIQGDVVPSARRIAEERGLELRQNPIFFNQEFRDIAGEGEISKIEQELENLRKSPATKESTKKMEELSKKKLRIWEDSVKKTREAAEEHSKHVSKLQKAGEESAAKLKRLDRAGKIGLGVAGGLDLADAGYRLHKRSKSNKKQK